MQTWIFDIANRLAGIASPLVGIISLICLWNGAGKRSSYAPCTQDGLAPSECVSSNCCLYLLFSVAFDMATYLIGVVSFVLIAPTMRKIIISKQPRPVKPESQTMCTKSLTSLDCIRGGNLSNISNGQT